MLEAMLHFPLNAVILPLDYFIKFHDKFEHNFRSHKLILAVSCDSRGIINVLVTMRPLSPNLWRYWLDTTGLRRFEKITDVRARFFNFDGTKKRSRTPDQDMQ